jgi:hypothetical protein
MCISRLSVQLSELAQHLAFTRLDIVSHRCLFRWWKSAEEEIEGNSGAKIDSGSDEERCRNGNETVSAQENSSQKIS